MSETREAGVPGRVKLWAATLGAATIAGMGVLTFAVGGPAANAEFQPGDDSATTTETTAPSEIETPSATPDVTATPYEPD